MLVSLDVLVLGLGVFEALLGHELLLEKGIRRICRSRTRRA
jgi:hypothetical protein